MRDWLPKVQKADTVEAAIQQEAYLKIASDFVSNAASKPAPAAKGFWCKHYEPNLENLRAIDNGLTAVLSFGLSAFVAERPPKPLTSSQSRYFVPATELPAHLGIGGGHSSRSCIVDSADNRRWLELSWVDRKFLVETLDCGAIGWPAKYWLATDAGLRTVFFADPCHLRWNRFKTSVRQAGLWPLWCEASVVVGLRKGPWSGAAHFATIHAAAMSYFETGAADDPLFMLCYDYIVQDLYRGQLPAAVHSEAHRKQVWEWLPQCPIWNLKGHRQQNSRFFQWCTDFSAIGEYLGCFLLILLRVALENKWYKNINDTPLLGNTTEASGVPEEDAPAPQNNDRLAADAAMDYVPTVDEKRLSSACTMHMATGILCDRTRVNLMKMIYIVGAPSKTVHDLQVTTCKTQLGTVEWAVGMCESNWVETCLEYADKLSNSACLLEIGFTRPDASLKDDTLEFFDERRMAKTMLSFVVRLLATEIGEGRMHSEFVPYRMCSLLSKDDGAKQRAFEYFRRCWDTLTACESASLTDDWLRSFLVDLIWPHQVWSREMLIGLAENNFASVCPAAMAEIQASARSFRSSKAVEDSFNVLRESERQHKASKLGRVARWHCVRTSGVLEDSDRRQPQIVESDKDLKGRVVPAGVFESHKENFSLGQEKAERFKRTPRPWAAPKPDDFHQVAVATSALLGSQGDFGSLKRAWLSLLLDPEVMIEVGSGDAISYEIVLEVTPYGAVCWRCSRFTHGQVQWWSLQPPPGAAPWVQRTIMDMTAVKVLEVDVVSPAAFRGEFLGLVSDLPTGLVLMAESTPMHLLKFAASRAFHNLTIGYLRAFADFMEYELPSPRPKSEVDWATFVIRAAEPAVSDDECRRRIEKWRGRSTTETWRTRLTERQAEQLGDVLDKDEAKSLREDVQASKVRARARAAALKPQGKAKPKAGARQPRLKQVKHQQAFTRLQAATYLPEDIRGCLITKDERLHFRWVGSYPNTEAPFSFSCVWNEGITEKQALGRVLRWVWACHTMATGQDCPWDLESL